jgi:hypothetical protein
MTTDQKIPHSREVARLAGATRYRTNLPCHRGHLADRWTSNSTCCACQRDLIARLKQDPAFRDSQRLLQRNESMSQEQIERRRVRHRAYVAARKAVRP